MPRWAWIALLALGGCTSYTLLPAPTVPAGARSLVLAGEANGVLGFWAWSADRSDWAELPIIGSDSLSLAYFAEPLSSFMLQPGAVRSNPSGPHLPPPLAALSYEDQVWQPVDQVPNAIAGFGLPIEEQSCVAAGGCLIQGSPFCNVPCPCVPHGVEPAQVLPGCRDPGPFREGDCYERAVPFSAFNRPFPANDAVGSFTREAQRSWLYFASDRTSSSTTHDARAMRFEIDGPMSITGEPELVPLLPPVQASRALHGSLNHLKVRADGLEIFFETSYPTSSYDSEKIWSSWRSNLEESFGLGTPLDSVSPPTAGSSDDANAYVHPILLADDRTLLTAHVIRAHAGESNVWATSAFRRPTTAAGSTNFTRIDAQRADPRYLIQSFALSCDRRNLIYVHVEPDGRHLVSAPIVAYEPLELGDARLMRWADSNEPIVFRFPGDFLLAESLDCDRLHYTTEGQTFVLQRVACP